MFDVLSRKYVRSATRDRKGNCTLVTHTRPFMLITVWMLVIALVGCSSVSPRTSTESKSSTATATTPATPATLPDPDWTTYHGNNTRTGYVANMPDPHKLTRAWMGPCTPHPWSPEDT